MSHVERRTDADSNRWEIGYRTDVRPGTRAPLAQDPERVSELLKVAVPVITVVMFRHVISQIEAHGSEPDLRSG